MLLVLTDGYSKASGRFGDGFHMARKEAKKVRDADIHIISVGLSSVLDLPELWAIASYPKLINTIDDKDGKSVARAIGMTDDIVNVRCRSPLIDVGVVFKPRAYKSTKESFEDQQKMLGLMTTMYRSIPSIKYYFNLHSTRDKHVYTSYSLRMLRSYTKYMHREGLPDDDLMERAKQAIAASFDEKIRKSLSKIKSFMIITYDAMSEEQVAELEELSGGEVEVVNVALNPSSIEDAEGKQGRDIFSYKEIMLYVKYLNIKKSESICD